MTLGTDLSRALRAIAPAVVIGEERGWAYFDGPSGTQMITPALDALSAYVAEGLSNRHGFSPAGDATESWIARTRCQLREMFRADDYDVVFGQNMTSLAFSFAHALARQHGSRGGAVAVSELEHTANVDPWVQAFEQQGGGVRWLRVEPESGRARVAHP